MDVQDVLKQAAANQQVGNPELVRHLQHLVQLAADGQIIGFVGVALGADGQGTHNAMAIPQHAPFIQNVLGAMQVLAADLIDVVRKARQQAQVSRIIKPARPPMG